ncbi:DUF58 domain-containing protein [Tissierella sp.]|uniref:DUF58 domain-containing protein n=1 Tax=Tissierella sp. TaxID=41274 RepID=UPI002856A2D8|nr:DUF58 domain-containing protein [Tissierella sp.]MDR7855975.1 DUF58 domain-containing protein [Tissierella sp.]
MTSFKYWKLFIIFIIFAFVVLVGGDMPYFILYISLLALLLPLIHCIYIIRKISGNISIPSGSLFIGDNIDIEYTIENNSPFPIPFMEIQSYISEELTGIKSPKIILSLDKRQAYSEKERLVLRKRGSYDIGDIEVNVRDIFGFYSFKKKLSSETSLIVYPEIVNLSTFKVIVSQQSGELLVHNSAFQDRSRTTSFRNYREGDSIKQIHWKLSSKSDNLIIKDFENRGDTNAIILIDNYKELYLKDVNRQIEDKVAHTALSLINYFLNQNVEVILETQNSEAPIVIQGQHKSDIKPFIEVLARFKGNGLHSFTSIYSSKIEYIKKGSTIIIITPHLDKEMGAYGIDLKMKGLKPLFIAITDIENKNGYIDLLVKKRLNEDGITVYIIDHYTSIKEALEVTHE